jgi:hypothetical protein
MASNRGDVVRIETLMLCYVGDNHGWNEQRYPTVGWYVVAGDADTEGQQDAVKPTKVTPQDALDIAQVIERIAHRRVVEHVAAQNQRAKTLAEDTLASATVLAEKVTQRAAALAEWDRV